MSKLMESLPRSIPSGLTPAQLVKVILLCHDVLIVWHFQLHDAMRLGLDTAQPKAMINRTMVELMMARTRLSLAMHVQDRES